MFVVPLLQYATPSPLYVRSRFRPLTVLRIAAEELDEDGSGRMLYDEMWNMTRHVLKLPDNEANVPERKLQQVWRALDDDNSGFITAGEFGRFMRLGAARCAQCIAERMPGANQSEGVRSRLAMPDPREEDRRHRREAMLRQNKEMAAKYLHEAELLEERFEERLSIGNSIAQPSIFSLGRPSLGNKPMMR